MRVSGIAHGPEGVSARTHEGADGVVPAESDAARLTISDDGGAFELGCARGGGVSSFTVRGERIGYEHAPRSYDRISADRVRCEASVRAPRQD